MEVAKGKAGHGRRSAGARWWKPWSKLRGERRYRLSETERCLIGAQGKALSMLVTALHARGHLDMREFAATLAIFSVVVAEDDELEGMILGVWSATLKDSL